MGLAPETFWRLSLVEWRAILSARFGPPDRAEPLTRTALARLMKEHPDG